MTNNSFSQIPLTGRQVIDNLMQGAIITDTKGTILAVNDAFSAITGYSIHDVLGKNPRLLQSGQHKLPFYKKMWDSLLKTGSWQGEITNKRKNGEIYTEWLSISSIRDDKGEPTHYLGVFTDITKRKRAESTIQHMAYYDSLTDLPNRTMFRERLQLEINQGRKNNEKTAVLFLDLDRVKIINDTLGHDMGDRLLKAVAYRLASCLRDIDTVARLGGDEFMILLPEVKDTDDVIHITKKILESLKPSFHFDNHELFITASIGISIFPDDGDSVDALLKNADTAMYGAKRRGRNNFQLFHKAMTAEVFQQLLLGNSMRRALERSEFVVYYQPQIKINTGELIGMEALVRWQHPELGIILPSKFIHWAEDSGLILPLGEMVLRMACAQNWAWQEAGYPPMRVSVNLSARQFKQGDMARTVARILKETKLPPDCLELELTESVLMESDPIMSIPHELKAMGIGFSIDDFGTGYSSLAYLKRLPVNALKMDQSFVHDLASNPNDVAIATAVIALGHAMNLAVVAEGVETEGQLDYLRALQCDRVQGFLVSEPVPAPSFERFLSEKRHLNGKNLFEN